MLKFSAWTTAANSVRSLSCLARSDDFISESLEQEINLLMKSKERFVQKSIFNGENSHHELVTMVLLRNANQPIH